MFRRFTKGKEASPAKDSTQSPKKQEQKPEDAAGFLCPMCMARLPGPAELQSHFETVHGEGGKNKPPTVNNESPTPTTDQLINIDDDQTDFGNKSKLKFAANENHPDDAQAEIFYLQQEMAELATAIKEEKWYSGQLKEEYDSVSKERDKLEEDQEEFRQEYESKLRSAEDSFLQVAEENEKLKDELKYADYKSQKERQEKMNAEIQSMKLDISQEREMKSAVEEANRHMMKQIEDKDKLLDDLKLKLNERPTNDKILTLETEVKDLKEKLENSKNELGKTAAEELDKWKNKIEELNKEISRLQLTSKELEIEKNAKVEQIQSIQTALSAALETSKQAQQQAHEKQQQIIDLQHEIRETQSLLKEKTAFFTHLEKQIEESKNVSAEEGKFKQDLQQQLRSLQNSLDDELRNVNMKDGRIYELENLLKKEKAEVQRLESEGSNLVAKIEAGAGVETAINQLRQEKEKLIDGVATMEKELEEQGKRHLVEINSQRDKNTKLVEEVEKGKINNEELTKKISELVQQIDMKEKSNEELRSQIRNKSEDLRKMESERSTEKANLEKQIQELDNETKSQTDEIAKLQQKISTVNDELSDATNSLDQHQSLLSQEKAANDNLREEIVKLDKGLVEKNELFISAQHELSQEKTERQLDVEKFNNEIAQYLQSLDEQKLKIGELSSQIDSRNTEINTLKGQLEKDQEERQLMQKEFDSLRENEVSLKSKIQELEEEFHHQKEILNEKIKAIIHNKEETENRFKDELKSKEEELEKLKESHAIEVAEMNKTIASNMAQYADDLQKKNDELAFISGSSKEAIARYQKSIEMFEDSLKNETDIKEKLQSTLKKIEEEKALVILSLEQKDTTLLEVQTQLEVAQKELEKACEGCHNYEIQLCRFQETHKEQINTVQKFEQQVEELNMELKATKNDYASLEENFQSYKKSAKTNESEMRNNMEQLSEVKAVLEARVLELDDELKEAYNKYDNIKTEMSTLSLNFTKQADSVTKLTELKMALEQEIISLKLLVENLKEEQLKEIEEERLKIKVIANQRMDVEKQLRESEKRLELEKLNHKESKETMEKIQNVLTEKSNAIQNKLDNTLREQEELIKSKEQSEARLSMEITSLKENLMRGRKEIESRNKKSEELELAAKRIEREKDELKGEIAVIEIQNQHTNDEKRALTERVLQSEEAHKRTKDRLSETNRRLEQSLAALQELGQENQAIQVKQNAKFSRQWEDDSVVTNCKNCDKTFSLTIRKHHCRQCGGIFCNECSSNYTQVAASKKPVRVCGVCYTDLNTIRGRRLSAASMT